MTIQLFKKVLYKGIALIRSLSPGREECAFVTVNSGFWREYRHDNPAARFVLAEQQSNPIINHCNASFAAMVCHAQRLRPLYLLNFWRDQALRRVLKSYAGSPEFVYTNGPRYLWPRLIALIEAWRIFRTLRSPADILDISIDGIRFGDIVYDNVLILGYATIKRIDIKVFAVLYAFHVHRHIIKDIIRRFRPASSVFSHTIGLVSGIYTRYLLHAEIEVINRVGSHQIILQKYRDISDVGFYPLKPEPRNFRIMHDHASDTVIQLAEAYLDARHNQRINHIAVEIAFDRGKRLFETHQQFCGHYGLDPGKKNVFVMLHGFNDHPHSHFARRMLYQDYFDWFMRTLEVAKLNPRMNWIFKEHPASQFYTTKDADLDAIFSGIEHPHIRFLNSTADFNALSIRFLANVIVTCLGTAGMEYACLGIPCVLAGESPYSGFGFTMEPGSVAEYENVLRGMEDLSNLDQAQVASAKIVMFFELAMMQDAPYHFCPEYDFRTIMTLKPHTLWRDLAALMQDPSQQSKLEDQIRDLTGFIRDPGYSQYVNLERYSFMREGIQHREGGPVT